MDFQYRKEEVFTKNIDIVDMGNCALRCTLSTGDDFYLLTKTAYGKTNILKYGPVTPDINTFEYNFSLTFQKIDFSEKKLIKQIDFLLNDMKLGVTAVEELPVEVALNDFPDIVGIYNSLDGGDM